MDDFPNFREALQQLGDDDRQRGAALGVPERTVRYWRANMPRALRTIALQPALIQALLRDAQEAAAVPEEIVSGT